MMLADWSVLSIGRVRYFIPLIYLPSGDIITFILGNQISYPLNLRIISRELEGNDVHHTCITPNETEPHG